MKTKFLLSTVLVLTLMLGACAPKAAPTRQVEIPTARPAATKPAATPTKIPEASPTAQPTTAPTKESASALTPEPALINDISVEDQTVQSDIVLITMVDAMQPGWVAIFTDENDQPGTLLGYVAVPAGASNDVKVTIDGAKASSKMIAMLLVDAGTLGTFEYPGPDAPVRDANINSDVRAVFSKISAAS